MNIYIWSLPTRIFHWLLVVCMVAAYILSNEEELLNYHSAAGYMVGIILIFRILWGFWGPKYSKFSDFHIDVSSLKTFLTDMKSSKSQSPGHNPIAAVVMLGIILCGLMIVVSGILLLASKGQGFFSSITIGLTSDTLKEIHEIAVNTVIGLVILHLLGNLVDFIFNKKVGTLQSMFIGYKNIEGESIKLSVFQKILATVGILLTLAIFPYSLINQKIDIKSEKSVQVGLENEEKD